MVRHKHAAAREPRKSHNRQVKCALPASRGRRSTHLRGGDSNHRDRIGEGYQRPADRRDEISEGRRTGGPTMTFVPLNIAVNGSRRRPVRGEEGEVVDV